MSRIPTVAVVGVEDGPEAGPGPAILACLAPSAARRVAIATSPFEAGALRADRVDRAVCVEPPELDEDAFRRGLLEAVEAEGIDVVVPGSPRVVGPLIRSRALLAGLGATVPLARSATADALERCGIHDACHRWGVATVTAWELGAAGDSSPATHEIGFPVMVTSSAAWRRRARDAAELSSIRNELRDLGVARITAVAEAAAQTFEWAGIVARGGTVRARAAVRVLMDDDRGRPWIAITIRHTDLDATAERLVAALDLEGAVVLTFQRSGNAFLAADARLGFPHWVEVGLAGGPNLVGVACAEAVGQFERAPGAVRAGILFSQTAEDLLVDPAEVARLRRDLAPFRSQRLEVPAATASSHDRESP